MLLPVFLLTIGSIFVGWVCTIFFTEVGTVGWAGTFSTHSLHLDDFIEHEFAFAALFLLLPLICSILMFFLFGNTIQMYSNVLDSGTRAFLNGFGLDMVWNKMSFYSLSKGYIITALQFDRGFFEYFGPFGIEKMVRVFMTQQKDILSGYLFDTITVCLFSFIPMIFFFFKYF